MKPPPRSAILRALRRIGRAAPPDPPAQEARERTVAENEGMSDVPFWRRKRLHEMNDEEWESLCDGCARCCLVKLEDDRTGEVHYTDIGCKLLHPGTCRCVDYANRKSKVPNCVKLTPENVPALGWLPSTCAYRLIAEDKDLAWWHPLVSGDPESVHQAGISVRGRTVAEHAARDFLDHIVDWPK